jgi:hypothetical protein
MADNNGLLTLYSAQSDLVIEQLKQNGRCFVKKEYVVKKYGESAAIFVTAYDWFVSEAVKYLAKPQEAEYPYWAFQDAYNAAPTGGEILCLQVPLTEAIFFERDNWDKILRLQYMGENEAEEAAFRQSLANYGVRREMDVMLTNFYPDLKRQVLASWQRLFQQHEEIRQGHIKAVKNLQAALWCLKKEWLA